MVETDGNGNGTTDAAALKAMTLGQLKETYREKTGQPPAFADRKKLIRILARKGAELATEIAAAENPAPRKAPRSRGRARAEVAAKGPIIQGPKSGKLPGLSPGTRLIRQYKGRRIVVLVLERNRFEFEGKTYRSLSALANEITKSHVSGNRWFGLTKPKKAKRS